MVKTPEGPPSDTLRTSAGADEDFGRFQSEYFSRYIELADAKAGMTFGVAVGIMAYLITSAQFELVARWRVTDAELLSFALGFALLTISAAMSFYVVVPRSPVGGDDLIYWRSVVATGSSDGMIERLNELTPEARAEQRLRHSFNLARTCDQKYRWLRRAMIVGVFGIAVILVWWLLMAT